MHSPLLSIPTELRLQIYTYLVPHIPLSCPPTRFTGLLYSCKYIRSELEPEILKRMTSFLQDVQRRVSGSGQPDFIFHTPKTLGEVLNLKVERGYGRDGTDIMFVRSDPFMAVLYMHLNSLRIQDRAPSRNTRRNTQVSLTKPISPRHKPYSHLRSDRRLMTQAPLGYCPRTRSSNVSRLVTWLTSTWSGLPPGASIITVKNIIYDWSESPIYKYKNNDVFVSAENSLQKQKKGRLVVWEGADEECLVFGVEILDICKG
ncbi:hypothetical protein P280DRAFT_216762 [Massarina eburnea CBS 473.64]|uniref:F-box domain-containing protein n=1 Tax=Massarina eburnea CBS 473.64 TaxID=1395130 RepID=A0A6A6S7S2_9PLEO|nr:hypothetical protein P280DRAFT_216762 [Massarina eburnea CBS 473.64]